MSVRLYRPWAPFPASGGGVGFRRDRSTDADVVEFPVTAAPAVILLLCDLSCAVSDRLFLPVPQALPEIGCLSAAIEDFRPQADQAVRVRNADRSRLPAVRHCAENLMKGEQKQEHGEAPRIQQ